MARKAAPVPPRDDLDHTLERVALADVRPHPRNYQTHPEAEIAHLMQSLTTHGVYRNVVIARDGTLLAGHGVVEAARRLGYTHLTMKRMDLDPQEPRALQLLVGDNEIAREVLRHEDALVALLEELAQDDPTALLGTGFDEATLEALADAQGLLLPGGSPGTGTPGGDATALPTVSLAERFLIPPFSVLDARQGYWQARKRAWIALGIQSELGRGSGVTPGDSAAMTDDTLHHYRKLQANNGLLGEAQQARSHYKVSPGGSPRDAATVGPDGRTQRGTGTGKPLARTKGSAAPGALAAAYKAQGRLTALRKTGDSRLTWVPGSRPHDDLDDTSRKNLAAGRQGHTSATDVLMEMAGGESASHQSGTSIFDPVLCELACRWFCPPGGSILDPFAGGSVRGIVAARLGRAYTGIDLRPEQVVANEAQWARIGAHPAPLLSPAPRVEAWDGLRIVRDDETPGGTKVRALLTILPTLAAEEVVYASPASGFAQIAIACAAALTGKRATIFTAARQTLHPCTHAAQAAGARIETVPHGYLSVVQARARAYCEATGAYGLPFGLDAEPFVDALATVARQTGETPAEVWCVAGSGVMARALRRAWPDARLCVVRIGKAPTMPDGEVVVYDAPEAFEDLARQPPPFASCGHYDAKAWQFITAHARPGALFWNVAGDPPRELLSPGQPARRWLVGDSVTMGTLALDPAYDFVFTCPPYADLEVYSDDPRDLSTMAYPQFVAAYRAIIASAVARLADDRFACIVVGDIRAPQGYYRNFISETITAFQDAGMRLYNEAILVTAVGSLPLRAGIPFTTTRKLGKTHQNVLIFCKGDPRRATEACGPVEVDDVLEAVRQQEQASARPDTEDNSRSDALP